MNGKRALQQNHGHYCLERPSPRRSTTCTTCAPGLLQILAQSGKPLAIVDDATALKFKQDCAADTAWPTGPTCTGRRSRKARARCGKGSAFCT